MSSRDWSASFAYALDHQVGTDFPQRRELNLAAARHCAWRDLLAGVVGEGALERFEVEYAGVETEIGGQLVEFHAGRRELIRPARSPPPYTT